MWGKERMFWWGLRWTTISHLGVRSKRRRLESNGVEGRGLQKAGYRLRRTQFTARTKRLPSVAVQQAAREILHKAVPSPSLGNQWVTADCSVVWTCSPPFRCLLPSCFPNYYTKQNKQALSRLEVGQTHIAPLAQLLKRLLAIAVFANKVWLSEPEHQRAGWIRQQQTQPADLGGLGAS